MALAPAVFQLDSDGDSRLLYVEGSPEAEEFRRKYGDLAHPVALTPADPDPSQEQDAPETVPDATDLPDDTRDGTVEDVNPGIYDNLEAQGYRPVEENP